MNSLKEINRKDTRLLFETDRWDGPLKGLMLWYGEKVWFNYYDDEWIKIPLSQEELEQNARYNQCTVEELDEEDTYDYTFIRYFNVYRLPKDVLEAIEHNHNLFRELVGEYSDYNENGARIAGQAKPTADQYFFKPRWWQFWKEDKTKLKKNYELKLDEYEIIGKFKY